jgi:hypothetical protein
MRSHWKDLALRASKAAFSPDQVCEALPHALKRDVLEAPIQAICEILGSDSLFPEMRIEQLEALRANRPGSATAGLAIDSAIAATLNGLTGDTGAEAALQSTLEGDALSACRGIEEHYQRETKSRSTGFVRDRLDAARKQLDCGALARELLAPAKPAARRSITLPRRKGVDEGPSL